MYSLLDGRPGCEDTVQLVLAVSEVTLEEQCCQVRAAEGWGQARRA